MMLVRLNYTLGIVFVIAVYAHMKSYELEMILHAKLESIVDW